MCQVKRLGAGKRLMQINSGASGAVENGPNQYFGTALQQ